MASVMTRTIMVSSPQQRNFMMEPKIQSRKRVIVEQMPEQQPEPKKRQRLTHLSPEERLLRRKLKNRVAAQTARDRKKARMDELEDALVIAEQENQRLQSENSHLRQQQENLDRENNILKARLGIKAEPSVVTHLKASTPTTESAALSPLQKDAVLTLFNSMTHLLALLMTLGLTSSGAFLPNCLAKTMAQKTTSFTPVRPTLHPPWWGTQQQSWNPSKN